jgi:hypothetical protein
MLNKIIGLAIIFWFWVLICAGFMAILESDSILGHWFLYLGIATITIIALAKIGKEMK